jgi:hypothetical protein
MEKLSGPVVMRQMLETHGSIEAALDATAKIMEDTHIDETIRLINSGEIHLGNLKTYIEQLNPKKPEEFAWKVLTHCSLIGSPRWARNSWACFRPSNAD